MGIIISRYMDPCSSEGALVKFIFDSVTLVRTVCTADTYFTELTPWNVIDFRTDDLSVPDMFSLAALLGQIPRRDESQEEHGASSADEMAEDIARVQVEFHICHHPQKGDLLYHPTARIYESASLSEV